MPPTTSSPSSTPAVSGRSSIRPWLVAPPILDQLGVAGAGVGCPDRDELRAVVAGFEAPDRVAVEPDGVPLLQLPDLVLDLDARAAADENVDLLLLLVAVPPGDAEARRQPEVAHAGALHPEWHPCHAGLDVPGETEVRPLVV